MSTVTELTSANFDTEVLQADKPYLVDFWAPRCGPCHMIAPVVAQIATEFADKISVGKLNVDDEQEIARRYRVMSIPTLVLFKKGVAATTVVGAMPKEQLLARIEPYL